MCVCVCSISVSHVHTKSSPQLYYDVQHISEACILIIVKDLIAYQNQGCLTFCVALTITKTMLACLVVTTSYRQSKEMPVVLTFLSVIGYLQKLFFFPNVRNYDAT